MKQTPCVDYGLIVGENDLEYPFWVLLKDSIGPEFRLEHVNVTNVSRVLSDEFPYVSFSPCALLVTRVDQPDTIIVRGVTFHRKWLLSPVSVYVKVE